MADLNFKEWKDSLRSFIEASANDIKWLQQLKVDKEQKIISENPELFEITGGWTDDPSGDGNYRIKKGTGLQDLLNDSHKKVTVVDGDALHNSPSSTTEVNGLILRGSEQELGVRTATRNNYGVVKLSSDLDVDQDGKLIITKDDFELNPATETDLGGVIVPISSKIDVDGSGVIDIGTDVATGIKFNSSTKIVTLINKNENGVTSGHSEIDLSGIAEMGTHFWYNPDGGDGYGYLEIYEDEDWDAVNNRPNVGATPTTSIPILDMLEGIGTELKFGDGSVGKEKYKLYLTDDSKTEYLSGGVSINIENIKELENELGDRVKKNSLVKAKEGIEVRRTRSPEGAFGSETELGDIPEFRIDKDFEDFNKYRTKAVQDTMHWRLKVGTSEIDVKPDGGDGELNPDTVELRGAGGVTVSKVANTSEDIIEIKGTTYSEITEEEVADKTSSSKRLISGRRFWKGFSTLIAEWWSNIEVSFAKMQNIPTKTLIGRYTAGDGKPQSITLGDNLTLSPSGVLNSANTETTYTASKGVKKVGNDFQADYDTSTLQLNGDKLAISQEVIEDVAKGVTAYDWGDFRDYGLGTEAVIKSGLLENINESGFYAFTTSQQGFKYPRAMLMKRGSQNYGIIFSNSEDKVGFLTGDGSVYTTWHSGNLSDPATKTWSDGRFALRTRTIAGTGSLTGGGDLTANRTIDLSSTTKSDIAEGVTAHGWGNHASAGYATETFVGDAVDDIEIGGRNYIVESNKYHGNNEWYSYGYAWGFLFYVDLKGGETYTISIPVRNLDDSNDSKSRIVVVDFESFTQDIPPLAQRVVKHTFTYPEDQDQVLIRFLTYTSGLPVLEWGLPKLEKGNKATDWTPAPEDQVTDWSEANTDAFSYLKNVPAKLKSATDDDVDNWNASLHEVDSKATKIEAEAGTNNTKYMTPLRTVEAMKGHEWIDYDPFEVYDTIVNGTTP